MSVKTSKTVLIKNFNHFNGVPLCMGKICRPLEPTRNFLEKSSPDLDLLDLVDQHDNEMVCLTMLTDTLDYRSKGCTLVEVLPVPNAYIFHFTRCINI